MGTETFCDSIKEELNNAYSGFFKEDWPTWLAGILIAFMALMIFLWSSPWGIAAGYRNLGDWFFFLTGASCIKPVAPLLHPVFIINFGLFLGALASALISNQFKIRRAPAMEYVKGLAGGILMGAGAALAGGCNVGGFYSAIGVLSIGGFAMMIGLGIGAYLGLKYLLWEMEHLPQKAVFQQPESQKNKFDWSIIQPYLGGLILLLIVAGFYIYSFLDKTELGGLLFFGLLIGLIMHRSRFCFVRAFRCPFMTGESEMVWVVVMSLMIYGFGSAVIKWNYLQPDTMGVYHPFWIGSLIGGVIFGIGMLLAGGCASSTLWRLGEGHTKLVLTFIAFAITNSLVLSLLKESGLIDKLGTGIFLPDILSWYIAVPFFVLILIGWIFIALWNEKSEKFVIF